MCHKLSQPMPITDLTTYPQQLMPLFQSMHLELILNNSTQVNFNPLNKAKLEIFRLFSTLKWYMLSNSYSIGRSKQSTIEWVSNFTLPIRFINFEQYWPNPKFYSIKTSHQTWSFKFTSGRNDLHVDGWNGLSLWSTIFWTTQICGSFE